MQELAKYVDVFDEDEGWELAQDDDGIKTMYRQEEGMPTLSVRVEGVVEVSAPCAQLSQTALRRQRCSACMYSTTWRTTLTGTQRCGPQ